MVQGAAVGGIYNGAEGAHRNPLNLLNPLNPLNLHTEGVSKGTSRLFFNMTVCCPPTPSSRAEPHAAMGDRQEPLP